MREEEGGKRIRMDHKEKKEKSANYVGPFG